MNWIVYKHISPSNKIYIGITKQNPIKRWKNGNGYNPYNKKTNIYFYNAILKYGWDNIKHEILYSNLTKEEACKKEIELIEYYKNLNLSYNITNGGEGHSHKHSKETLIKLRESHLGQKGYWTGKSLSKEHKDKLRESHKNKKPWNKGIKTSIDVKIKQSNSHKKEVIQCDINFNIINKFNSLSEAAQYNNISISTVSKSCTRGNIIKNNYIFKFNN